MVTKVRELDPHRRDRDDRCVLCHPPGSDRITESDLWARRFAGWRPKRRGEA